MRERVNKEHVAVIKTLADCRGWSKHKLKSIRGQVLSMKTSAEREDYLRKIIRIGI